MRISVLFIFLLVLVSCVDPAPRRPVSHRSQSFIKESVERNKRINELEEKAIKYYIANDSINTYLESPDGFWYRIIQKNNISKKHPKTGDVIQYNYQISNIYNKTIYSFSELGNRSYMVDKEEIELGLQKGFKLMKEGEEFEFLFPSFNAYGLLGDKERIGMNEPLIYSVQLIKIN